MNEGEKTVLKRGRKTGLNGGKKYGSGGKNTGPDEGKRRFKMEEDKLGNFVGRRIIPGIAWQDDLIIIANNQDNEKKINQ